ncbi:MAG: alpha-amylase family glycosyl hydrolase [Acidobacteriota bacterium]
MSLATAPTQWWQTGVIYQVYPRSFQDTPNPLGQADGIGDLRGILARLDYLAQLGIAALWISPIYPSPMADFGYDVANYTAIDPLFGTLEDFDELLLQAHKRNLRVILDFVPNHTSDQHPWFLESRSSRDNPKRDWYLWHDAALPGDDWQPAKNRVPNNWMSHFGGPAWTWDETTQQFYLHSFLAQQPDLNWRNPQVREAMYAAMRFWLDRGVDGFRMDVLWLLIKDAHFRSNPPNPAFHDAQHDHRRHLAIHNADQPETHQIVAEMRSLLDSYGPTLGDITALQSSPHSQEAPHSERSEEPRYSAGSGTSSQVQPPNSNRVLIGEIYLPLPELVRYYGPTEAQQPQLTEANLPFNFHLIQTPWQADAIATIIRTYEGLLPIGAWPNYVLGNHDQPRLASRIGPLQAKAAAMLLLTLRGTPTLYNGDELGMVDVPIAPDQVQDPAEKNEPGKGRGRDPERSPMMWTPSPNAGFTTPDATPWLPLQSDWPTQNAQTQSQEPRSMLTLYRHLLALRRQHDTLHSGAIADVVSEGTILRYRRVAVPDGESTDFQIILNLGPDPATTTLTTGGTIVLTTILDGAGSTLEPNQTLTLESGEGLLIALDE